MGGPERVWTRCRVPALCSRPISRLLTSSCSWRSRSALDGEPELLLELVHRVVVQVGDPGVDAQHGLGDLEFVLAGAQLVVDERARQRRLPHVSGRQLDRGLAVPGPLRGDEGTGGCQVGAERAGAGQYGVERAALQGEDGTAGERGQGAVPGARLAGHQLIADEVAVREHTLGDVLVVPAPDRLAQFAVCDQYQPVGGPALLLQDHLAGAEVALLAPVGEGLQHRVVVVAAQQRQLGELQRDDPDLGAGGDELHPAVPECVGQPPVHPEGAARHLHPRQGPQQPPRGDPLHLRGRLRGGREIPCRFRGEALLRLVRTPVSGIPLRRSRHPTPPILVMRRHMA